jgi:hypothetical protein
MDNRDVVRSPEGDGLLPSVEPVPVSPLRAAIPSAEALADFSAAGFNDVWDSRPPTPTRDKQIEITVVGKRCIYVNDYRVAGGKPYLSENLPTHDLSTTLGEILDAFPDATIQAALREKLARQEYIAAYHSARAAASAIETGTAKTEGLGPQDESAAPKADAQGVEP